MNTAKEIKCTVHDCKHNDHVQHCQLNDILVGGTESKVTSKYQTDCMSFEAQA